MDRGRPVNVHKLPFIAGRLISRSIDGRRNVRFLAKSSSEPNNWPKFLKTRFFLATQRGKLRPPSSPRFRKFRKSPSTDRNGPGESQQSWTEPVSASDFLALRAHVQIRDWPGDWSICADILKVVSRVALPAPADWKIKPGFENSLLLTQWKRTSSSETFRLVKSMPWPIEDAKTFRQEVYYALAQPDTVIDLFAKTIVLREGIHLLRIFNTAKGARAELKLATERRGEGFGLRFLETQVI